MQLLTPIGHICHLTVQVGHTWIRGCISVGHGLCIRRHLSLRLSWLWRRHGMERLFPSSPYVLSQTPTTFHMTNEVIMENNINSSDWVIANIYSVRMCQELTIPVVLHVFIHVNPTVILWARCYYYLYFLRHTVNKLPKVSQLVLVRGEGFNPGNLPGNTMLFTTTLLSHLILLLSLWVSYYSDLALQRKSNVWKVRLTN